MDCKAAITTLQYKTLKSHQLVRLSHVHRLKSDVFDEDEAIEDKNLNLRIEDENQRCLNALTSCRCHVS